MIALIDASVSHRCAIIEQMFADDAIASVAAAVRVAADVDRTGWPGSDRSRALLELVGARERLDALILAVAGEWEAERAWAADGARSPVAWLSHRAPLTRQDASTLLRTARHVHAHEKTAAALATGEISASHADLAARAARHREDFYPDHEEVILDAARELPPSAFRIAVAHWASCVDAMAGRPGPEDRLLDNYLDANGTFEGAGHLDGRLDPVSFKALIDRLDALEPPDPVDGPTPPRPLARRRADALMRLVHGERRGEATVDVLVDVDTLAGRPSPDLTSGCCEIRGLGPVSPTVAQTLACDCAIGRVLVRGRSEVLDLGRRTRLVTPALRRMLEIRDRTCTVPGCDVPGEWCDAHHIIPWWAHGPTDGDNLTLRCRSHHLQEHRRHRARHRRTPSVRGDPADLALGA
jgi:hypothetical protein